VFEDAEPDVGGDGRYVDRYVFHVGWYVRRRGNEAVMCRILSDLTRWRA
jgi:hypothetical protein